MPVSVNLQANTGPASKELESFGKRLTGLTRIWENAFGGKGQRQAGQNLQQLSKGVAALAKQADAANDRLKRINQTLDQVTSKRKALEGTMGAVNLRDKDAYKLAADQERMLTRQQRTWQAIAATRQQMAQNAQGQPGPGGTPGPNGPAPFGGRLGPLGGTLGQVAGTLGKSLAGVIGVGALAGMAVHAVREALDTQRESADFIPRMRPGNLAGTDAFGLNKRMRGVGRPFGFNTRESIAVFQAMSEGGGNFGQGLEKDSRTAMQMGRMFGIDAGGEASMLASAQKTGAFKAGDAKRFAGMLAEQIARTGLGPRAQEVQEATLMLLNQQMHQIGTANAGPIMALQTLFNKTGIAGLQGMAGANTISRLQDAVTNPQSEASEALNFSVFRKMGAKSLYDVKYLQEEGLNNRKYLPTLFQTVEGSATSNQSADLALKDHTQGALSLHMLKMLRGKLGGRLSNLTTGSLTDIQSMLGKGGAFVEKGGQGAMDAMPGNQLRKIEADIHDLLMKFGEPAAAKLISIATGVDRGVTKLADILTSNRTVAQKTTAIYDYMTGRQVGTTPSLGQAARNTVLPTRSKNPNPVAAAAEDMQDAAVNDETSGKNAEFRGNGWAKPNANFSLGMGQKFHWKTHYIDREGNVKRRKGPKGSATNPPIILPDANGNYSDPTAKVKGSFETMDAGGYAGAQVSGGTRHLHITIEEKGVLADSSKQALKQYIRDCTREAHHEDVRAVPNNRNRRD